MSGSTNEAREYANRILELRAAGWEQTYFEKLLALGLTNLAPKLNDYEIRYSWLKTKRLDQVEATDYIDDALENFSAIGEKMSLLISADVQTRAFGEDGEPGDPARIEHLAMRWTAILEEFLEWWADVKCVRVDSHLTPVFEALSAFVHLPIHQYREFVHNVQNKDEEEAQPPQLTISTDPAVVEAFVTATDIVIDNYVPDE